MTAAAVKSECVPQFALLLLLALGALSSCASGAAGAASARMKLEKAEDSFCADVAEARKLEKEFGVETPNGGEALSDAGVP